MARPLVTIRPTQPIPSSLSHVLGLSSPEPSTDVEHQNIALDKNITVLDKTEHCLLCDVGVMGPRHPEVRTRELRFPLLASEACAGWDSSSCWRCSGSAKSVAASRSTIALSVACVLVLRGRRKERSKQSELVRQVSRMQKIVDLRVQLSVSILVSQLFWCSSRLR